MKLFHRILSGDDSLEVPDFLHLSFRPQGEQRLWCIAHNFSTEIGGWPSINCSFFRLVINNRSHLFLYRNHYLLFDYYHHRYHRRCHHQHQVHRSKPSLLAQCTTSPDLECYFCN
jgi:hypothetical protein